MPQPNKALTKDPPNPYHHAPRRWGSFDPPPLTIVYPEKRALANPPLLMWQPQSGASRYRVSLTGIEGTVEDRRAFNFFTPAAPLPPGTYRLTVEAQDPQGHTVGISKSQFELSEGHASPGDMNALRVDKGSFLLPPAQVERIRKATGEVARWRDQLLDEARKGDEAIAGTLQEPRRYPNYTFDFHFWHDNNQYVIRIENAVLANTLAWALTEESRFFEEVRRLVLQLVAWDPTGATGVWENDHSAQAILNALAIPYSTMGHLFSAEERNRIRACIAARCDDALGLLNPFVMRETSSGPMNDPDNNHPWFTASSMGMGALALAGEHERAELWASCAAQLYWGNFLSRGGHQGGWHEGIDYWSYSLFFVFQFADALKNATGVNLYKSPWLSNTAFYKIYCHPPAGGYAPFGDCKHHAPNAFDKMIMMRLASEYGDPLAWKYVDAIPADFDSTRTLFWALLWSDRSRAEGLTVREVPFVKHFEDIGWVVSANNIFNASNQSFFAMRCGPFHGRAFGHTHGDQNSFVLARRGEKLLWDAGYYDSYLSPHHRNYSRHSEAHNTLLVDGEGQVVHIRGINGRIAEFSAEGTSVHVVGDASEPLIYGGKLARFLRTFEYSRMTHLRVEDDILLRDPARVSFLLHSVYPMAYDARDRSVRICGERSDALCRFDSSVPVDVIIRTAFLQEPNLTSKVLEEEMRYPPQFHLEFRTLHPVLDWKPCLTVEVIDK